MTELTIDGKHIENTDDVVVQCNLRLPYELLERIDAERGDVPRNTWITDAIETELDADENAKTYKIKIALEGGDEVATQLDDIGERLDQLSQAFKRLTIITDSEASNNG